MWNQYQFFSVNSTTKNLHEISHLPKLLICKVSYLRLQFIKPQLLNSHHFERTEDFENDTSDYRTRKGLSPSHAIFGDFVTSDQETLSREIAILRVIKNARMSWEKKKQWINLAKKRGITNLMFIHKKVGNTISVYYYCTYIFNKLRRLLCKRYHLKPVVQRYYKLSAAQITYDITLNTSVLYCVMVVRPNRRLWLSRNKIWRRELQTILQRLQTFILYYYYYIVRFHSRKRVKFCFSKTGWKLRELIPSIKLIPKVIPVKVFQPWYPVLPQKLFPRALREGFRGGWQYA